jgi:transcriptional regulator with XRE-family HTH domain
MSDHDETYFGNESATFGDRVTAAREAAALSEASFARKLGVKLKTVQSWEQDLGEPRANKLQMMAGMLNVSMRWLLTGEGDGPVILSEAEPVPGDLAELLADLRRSRADMKKMTDNLARMEARVQSMVAKT